MSRIVKLLVVVLAVAGLNTANAAVGVDFIINGGFETEVIDPLNPVGPDYGGQTAEPWSYWGSGDAPGKSYDKAAIDNPVPGVNNSSDRVWANFGNPSYVNVASYNLDRIAGNASPKTGMWLVPDATFRFQVQYYVPTQVLNHSTGLLEDNIPAATTEARAGIVLRTGSTSVYPLNPRDPGDAAASSFTTYNQWVDFDFDWTFDAATNPNPASVSYPSFRLYGSDGTNVGGDVDPGLNPGGYFDNCQISSDDYRSDLHGFVVDGSGTGIEGAVVRLRSPFIDYDAMTPEEIEAGMYMDEVLTSSDGSYTLPTWAPLGYEFSVDSPGSLGAQFMTIDADNSQFANIVIPEPATMSLLAIGGLALIRRRRRA